MRFLLSAALALSACGVTELPVPGDLRAACEAFYREYAAYDARCTGLPALPTDEQAIVDSCVGFILAPGVTLTTADVAACTAEIAESPCLGGGWDYPSCTGQRSGLLYPHGVRKGTLSPGAACFADAQCDSGACSSASLFSCGFCYRVVALGAPCGGTPDHCEDEAQCTEGICQHGGKKPGEECVDFGGGDCQKTAFCRTQPPGGGNGTCTLWSELGEPCGQDLLCAQGTRCAAGVCRPLLPAGGSCTGGEDCQSASCFQGICRDPVYGLGPGADCSLGECGPGLVCLGDLPTCTDLAIQPEGAACDDSERCAPGLFCDRGGACTTGSCLGSLGICRALPGPGEPCGATLVCAPGATCEGFDPAVPTPGVCTRLGGEGEACPCGRSLVCAEDRCAAYGAEICP